MRSVSRRNFMLGTAAAALLTAGTRVGTASAAPRGAAALGAPVDTPAVRAAIARLLGRSADQFTLQQLTPGAGEVDAFEIGGTPGAVRLSASSPVAALSAFQWWLKYVAGGHLSTNGDRISLPATLPAPPSTIRQSTELTERYAYNFTVFGYTSPFWSWSEWERELDLLAANGINRALALIGQEIVWYDTFRDFGLDELTVRQWIAQPAHQPWQWYGEITGYDEDASAFSGPVSVGLLQRRAALGVRIVDRMRELGITPVFPAFVGHVPDQMFADEHPGTNIPAQGDYAGHARPYWLDTTEALYPPVAERFYEAQAAHFGTTTHYSNDLFHEVGESELPALLNGADLGDAAVAVQDALEAAVPGAIWLMQGWQDNPQLDVLNAVDENRIVVLDLDSDDTGKWAQTGAYWGVPWCWGSIQNFGGRPGMFGNLTDAGRTLPGIRQSSTRKRLVGTAWVQEGTHNNPVVGDLLGEVAWRRDPVALEPWVLAYARRRYGVDDPHAAQAWRILLDTAYSFSKSGHTTGEGPHESFFAMEPTLDLVNRSVSMFGPDDPRYDLDDFAACLPELLQVPSSVRGLATYRYDLVDVTRQVLANRGRVLLARISAAFDDGDTDAVTDDADRFLHALDLSNEILGTDKHWLLGTWLEQAKAWGATAGERNSLEWNARSMLTIWTIDAADTLREYAHREWHGLLSGYYRPRWERFFDALPDAIDAGDGEPSFDDWNARGNAWSQQREVHRTQPVGDTFTIASRIAGELAADPL
ncbi:alpha-N-acetylglucosaminidase [Actinokineospora globicatena]|uniref:alpha-N-acetylglucosaminidase n=1 Tax=Actinokineospora globicatena TaxID=103729 RepID=UPI0020A32C90|nr:alpha-N-acetylglucosaminidase [Actinokineospora globicatena]